MKKKSKSKKDEHHAKMRITLGIPADSQSGIPPASSRRQTKDQLNK
jgi:hypothetical protein